MSVPAVATAGMFYKIYVRSDQRSVLELKDIYWLVGNVSRNFDIPRALTRRRARNFLSGVLVCKAVLIKMRKATHHCRKIEVMVVAALGTF